MRLYEIDGKLRDKLKKIHHLYVAFSFLIETDLKKASELSTLLEESIKEIYPTTYDNINKDLEKWLSEVSLISFELLKNE